MTAKELCPKCLSQMRVTWGDSLSGCGWYLVCDECDYWDENSYSPGDEEKK